ncbi:phosphodiester glycosidase family protein [Bacillus horti]|uniref:Exopolysaccharide biosynthesis protein n=1 Tax=Caldalkalibacillus horti TaxID=77523 RepID=A0ABT9W5C4_9BACI|nr:phosphodiester glycosidase family protein [Bacillus horti]MDQ0168457.1 exopolysaccharide biosynthesis protein [Bacillus horti]
MSTKVHVALALFFALVVGVFVATFQQLPQVAIQTQQLALPLEQANADEPSVPKRFEDMHTMFESLNQTVDQSNENTQSIRTILSDMTEFALAEKAEFDSQAQMVADARKISAAETKKSADLLDTIITNLLGDPIGQTFGDNSTIKVFSLKEAGYRGYMAKVRLHNPKAVRLALAGDGIGNSGETTSQAGKRHNAALAINGGGYARGADGLLYPIGITVVDGEIKTFYRTDLSFVGFNSNGHLVGGDLTTREQIQNLDVQHGATFVPTLLKDGKKMPIPKEWQNTRHPRTLIGHFSNGDVLFIVIDGRQKGYSNGVTLEEAQDKLLEFKVVDAYTLDGGGSSAFYYNGKLLNSPSDGRERRLPTNFVVMP